jgi:hypothetical protein
MRIILLLLLPALMACDGTVTQTGPIRLNPQNPNLIFHEIPFVVTRHDCSLHLTHVLVKFTFTVNGKQDWQMTSMMIEPERENPYTVYSTVEARAGEEIRDIKLKGYSIK